MDNFLYYAFALAALVIGIVVLKKVATCMIKMVVGSSWFWCSWPFIGFTFHDENTLIKNKSGKNQAMLELTGLFTILLP